MRGVRAGGSVAEVVWGVRYWGIGAGTCRWGVRESSCSVRGSRICRLGEPLALSEASRSVWAKSPNAAGAWLPLWQHMDDSADVAGHLFDRWLAASVVDLLAREFGGDTQALRLQVLPAHAGMILGRWRPSTPTGCALRARGDDPVGNTASSIARRCSSHTRG
ncbi:HD domain-containing protein [Nocardia sp. NPDC004278]